MQSYVKKANKEDHSDKFALRGSVRTPITASNDFDVEDYTYSHFHCTGVVTQPKIDHILIRIGITITSSLYFIIIAYLIVSSRRLCLNF